MPVAAPEVAGSTVTRTSAEVKDAAATRRFVLAGIGVIGVAYLVMVLVVVPELWTWLGVSSLVAAALFLLGRQLWRSFVVRVPRARKRARGYRNSAQASEGTTLHPGPTVLHGRVAYAAGASEAMRVELVERGREVNGKNGWSHTWTEESRRRDAHPFYLVRANGQRVRVEADARSSQLFDTLEPQATALPGAGLEPRRTRVARLDPQEEIWVVGELAEGDDPEAEASGDAMQGDDVGYRQNARPTQLVIRAAPTLVVSSVSLVEHFTARAKLHRRHGLVALVLILAPLFLAGRLLDRVAGHAAQGTLQNVHAVHSSKTHALLGYEADVVVDGEAWPSELMHTKPAAGATYIVRVGKHSSNDGPDFHATSGETIFAFYILGIAVLAAFLWRLLSLQALPWFRSVGNFVESGPGRLQLPSKVG